mmetsp:Transcript_3625/g.9126  ORF Transcript_3625/g.9126 Transcript_3625/m.9126 type:complete len:222 (-) Transcript_3625:923-1588(-)
MCEQMSRAAALTSSTEREEATICVASWVWAASINVCPHATFSMRYCSWSWLVMRSPCAASCSESERSAARQRCSSICETPCSPMRLNSRTVMARPRCQSSESTTRSRAHTTQPSRGESRYENSTIEMGLPRACTLRRIWSATTTMRLMMAARKSERLRIGSTGSLAKMCVEKLCMSSCWKMCTRGSSAVPWCLVPSHSWLTGGRKRFRLFRLGTSISSLSG